MPRDTRKGRGIRHFAGKEEEERAEVQSGVGVGGAPQEENRKEEEESEREQPHPSKRSLSLRKQTRGSLTPAGNVPAWNAQLGRCLP